MKRPGAMRLRRISRPSVTPTPKNERRAPRYIKPMRLWSVDIIQAAIPRYFPLSS